MSESKPKFDLVDALRDIQPLLPWHVQQSVEAANGTGPPGPFVPVYVHPLTLAEYLDPDRYPVTSVEGATPLDQFDSDAIRFRDLWESIGNGRELTAAKRAELVELMRKIPNLPKVLAELRDGSSQGCSENRLAGSEPEGGESHRDQPPARRAQ